VGKAVHQLQATHQRLELLERQLLEEAGVPTEQEVSLAAAAADAGHCEACSNSAQGCMWHAVLMRVRGPPPHGRAPRPLRRTSATASHDCGTPRLGPTYRYGLDMRHSHRLHMRSLHMWAPAW
jgi:hypothetical protein